MQVKNEFARWDHRGERVVGQFKGGYFHDLTLEGIVNHGYKILNLVVLFKVFPFIRQFYKNKRDIR